MTYAQAYEKALKLLDVRFLSEGELRKKLQSREVATDLIDQVIARLKEQHFLDDQRLAEAVYRYYARKGQYGHRYIINRLRLRQLPVPADIERPDEYAIAEKLVAKKFPHGGDPRKIARYLSYRGLAPAVIREFLWP